MLKVFKDQDLKDAERRVVSAPFNFLLRRYNSTGQTGSSENLLERRAEDSVVRGRVDGRHEHNNIAGRD